jgi:hypothetical protein
MPNSNCHRFCYRPDNFRLFQSFWTNAQFLLLFYIDNYDISKVMDALIRLNKYFRFEFHFDYRTQVYLGK